jgi:3-methyl-2-oxobutanoate hydroxymethyltransferase
MERKKVTISDIQTRTDRGEKVFMVTAVDYPSAQMVDKAEVDLILVGDSLGMTALGLPNTVPVEMDDIIHHARAVTRGAQYAFVVGDMPFGSYQVSVEETLRNGVRLMKEGGVDGVKLEGGVKMAPMIRALVDIGIPVCAHIGLTPQTISALGGFKVQGKDLAAARGLIEDAKAVEEAGAFAIVVEAVPAKLAYLITESVSIPTIGIGAGPGCKGQCLVLHDMVGMFDRFTPKFARRYANVSQTVVEAIQQWRTEVKEGQFPAPEHTFAIKDEVIKQLRDELGR